MEPFKWGYSAAYRDKLERSHAENYTTDFYYKKYGVKIVEKYRERALDTFGSHFFRQKLLMSLDIAVFTSQLQIPSFFSQINNFGFGLWNRFDCGVHRLKQPSRSETFFVVHEISAQAFFG